MTTLPRLVQRAPQIFYGAAVIFFIFSVLLTHLQLGQLARMSAGSGIHDQLVFLSAYFQAAQTALFIAADGVIVHVLLAIWRNGRPQPGRGDDQ